MVSLQEIMRQTRKTLENANIENAALDARILVLFATNTKIQDLILNPEMEIDPTAQETLKECVEKRLNFMPVYRIVGQREFYGLNFYLSKDTLEPRADTEVLVDIIIDILQDIVKNKGKALFLDMGTGTGAIAIATLRQVKNSFAIGVDIAKDALDTALKNAQYNGVHKRFKALESDWFSNVVGKFDLIVSNPPYIRAKDIANLDKEVRLYDPIRALDGGEDGLDFYKKLAQSSAQFLHDEGIVAVEIGKGQENDVIHLFKHAGFSYERIICDLSNIVRVLVFKKY